MPNRTKHEAQLRMSIGMARVLRREGKDAREGLEAFKEHFATVNALERSQPHETEEPSDNVKTRNGA